MIGADECVAAAGLGVVGEGVCVAAAAAAAVAAAERGCQGLYDLGPRVARVAVTYPS